MQTSLLLNETASQIRQLLPVTHMPKKQRTKRALLGFIGQFSKSLFGTATTDDVNIIAQHINALTKNTLHIANELTQRDHKFSSFMSTLDKRMSNAMQGIVINHEAIRMATESIAASERNVQNEFASLTSIVLHNVQQAALIEHKLNEFKLGVLNLVQGKISPLLLSADILSKTIHHIQRILNDKFQGFHLIQKNPAFYYNHGKFIYARISANKLFVTVKFPIASMAQPFKLFKIISLPVPINSTAQQATQLLNLAPFFAISTNGEFYTNIPTDEFTQCFGTQSLHCPFKPTLLAKTKPSCEMALFQNNKNDIFAQCDFRVLWHKQPSQLIEINPTSLLVYNTPLLSLTCSSGQKVIQGCTFCLVKIPCLCSVSTQTLLFSASIGTCQKQTSENVTYLHPINLALLQHFFDSSTLNALSGTTMYDHPINVTIPQLHMFNHKFKSIIAQDKKAHLSLKRIAHSVKNQDVIFESLTESLLDGEIDINSSWFDLKSILIIVSLGVSALAVAASITMFLKIKTLTAMVLVLQNVAYVKAAPLPSFNYVMPVTPATTSFFPSFQSMYEHIPMAMISICVILLAVLLYKVFAKRSHDTYILLEITTGSMCEIILIMSLSLCPSYWKIEPPTRIADLHITNTFNTKLNITWTNFNVKGKYTHQALRVPQTFTISPIVARRLRKILTQPFATNILIQHGNMYQPLEVELSDDH